MSLLCYYDQFPRVFLSNTFHAYGLFVARHPRLTISISFAVFIFWMIGVMWMPPLDADINSVWLPDGGWEKTEKAYKETNFGRGRLEQYIITSKTGEDLLAAEKNALNEIFDLFERVSNLEVADRETGVRYQLADLCLAPILSICLEYGPLDYWGKDRETMIADDNLHQTVSEEEFQSSLGPLKRDLVVGGITFDENGTVIRVDAFQQWIFLDYSDAAQNATPRWQQILEDWEAEFILLIQEPYQYIAAVPQAQRSQADVIDAAMTGDIVYLGGAFMLVNVCFLVALFRYDKSKSKVTLGFSGVLAIFFSIGSTFGSFGWFQTTNYPGAYFVYFMILALSINHHYLLIHAVNRHTNIFELDKRLAAIAGEILPSIYISNLCPLVPVIIIYCTTDMKAMEAVSYAAFVGLILELFFITTWFIPCLYFDALRNRIGDTKIISQYSNVDINSLPDNSKSNGSNGLNETSQLLHPEQQKKSAPLLRRVSSFREPTLLNINFIENSSAISKFYQRFILKPLPMFLIILALLGFVAWGISGIVNWIQVFDRGDLSAEDDYLNEFLRQTNAYFGDLGVPLDMVIEQKVFGEDVLYNETETALTILEIETQFKANPYIRNLTWASWYDEFLIYLQRPNMATCRDANGLPIPSQYDRCFQSWLNLGGGRAYSQDMQFYTGTNQMRTSKFRVETIALPTMELQTDAVVQLHALTESFLYPNENYPREDGQLMNPLKTFVNGGPWAIFAAFEPVRVEGIQIAYLVPGVTLLLTLFVTNGVSVFLMTITIACVNVVMFGAVMKSTEIAITESSLPNIMMISIIAFSHCIHLEFGFSFYQGKREDKILDCIWSHAAAIIYSSICILIGSLPLIACKSGLNIVFAIMCQTTVLISAGYAVLMLVILLFLFGLPTRKGDYPEIA